MYIYMSIIFISEIKLKYLYYFDSYILLLLTCVRLLWTIFVVVNISISPSFEIRHCLIVSLESSFNAFFQRKLPSNNSWHKQRPSQSMLIRMLKTALMHTCSILLKWPYSTNFGDANIFVPCSVLTMSQTDARRSSEPHAIIPSWLLLSTQVTVRWGWN